MFSVIFEVLPRKENWDDYLENAKMLRPEGRRGTTARPGRSSVSDMVLMVQF